MAKKDKQTNNSTHDTTYHVHMYTCTHDTNYHVPTKSTKIGIQRILMNPQ